MLTQQQVETVFVRIRDWAPRGPRPKHVKEEADHFRNLVACLLSAQSRDSNTAKAKQGLFALADTPEGILALDEADIAAAIKPCGLYNIKARNLQKMCSALLNHYHGIVPKIREDLMALPGIGRKCADIMLQFSFGEEAIAVDTHIFRLCNRSGLATGKTEAQTAIDLDERAPQWAKREGHLWLLDFGKQICRSRRPRCEICPINDLCGYNRRQS